MELIKRQVDESELLYDNENSWDSFDESQVEKDNTYIQPGSFSQNPSVESGDPLVGRIRWLSYANFERNFKTSDLYLNKGSYHIEAKGNYNQVVMKYSAQYRVTPYAIEWTTRPLNTILYGITNSFTDNYLQSDIEDEFQKIIYMIKNYVNDNIADQLLILNNMVKTEEPLEAGINIDSLQYFYRFLATNLYVKAPIISITNDFNIYASWEDINTLFSLNFRATGDVFFVLFYPNEKYPKKKIRISGKSTYDEIFESVNKKHLKWIIDK